MAFTDTLTDIRLKTMNGVHRTVLTLSGGRIGSRMGDMPVVKVTTTGRRSGQDRTVMLTAPVRQDDRWVLVASKAGDDRDPDWYRNMVANPEFTLQPAGSDETLRLVARTATPEEKEELWSQIVDAYKGYAGYANKTDRDIPVVVAEPAPTEPND